MQKSRITGGLGKDENERTAEMPEDKTNRERKIGEERKSEDKVLWDIQWKIGKLQRKESKE